MTETVCEFDHLGQHFSIRRTVPDQGIRSFPVDCQFDIEGADGERLAVIFGSTLNRGKRGGIVFEESVTYNHTLGTEEYVPNIVAASIDALVGEAVETWYGDRTPTWASSQVYKVGLKRYPGLEVRSPNLERNGGRHVVKRRKVPKRAVSRR